VFHKIAPGHTAPAFQNGIDKHRVKIPQHIELQSPTFEIEDLKRLIKSTTKDLVKKFLKNRQINFQVYSPVKRSCESDRRLRQIFRENEQKKSTPGGQCYYPKIIVFLFN
jgi:hypothetical protein